MWGFALLDTRTRRLMLSRDRFGIKPVYVLDQPEAVYIASEIKALLAASGERFRVNCMVAERYIAQNQFEAQDETFFHGIESLPRGTWAEIALDGDPSVGAPVRYWSVDDEPEFDYADQEALEVRIRELFRDAVSLRTRSDVPVGVLLSGGLDSSAITAMMHELAGGSRVQILSAVSDDPRFNEEPFIDMVAAHIGREPIKVRLDMSPGKALEALGTAIRYNDEPVLSFSNVIQRELMAAAREQGIVVALSGQGGDETLCGYKKRLAFHLQSLLRRRRHFKLAAEGLGLLRQWKLLAQFNPAEARRYLSGRPGRGLDVRGPRLREAAVPLELGLAGGDIRDRQLRDIYKYSVPALVHYEDRMSMSLAREIRVPFLDYRLVSLLVRLPAEYKLRGGWTKWIFRKTMAPMLPRAVAWRRDKKGFDNPESEWLRNELRPDYEKMLAGDMASADLGFIDREALRTLYDRYCNQRGRLGGLWLRDVLCPLALEVCAREFEAHLRGE